MKNSFEQDTTNHFQETPLAQAGKLLRIDGSPEVMEQVWELFTQALPEGHSQMIGREIGRPILEMDPVARERLVTPAYISERIDYYLRELTDDQLKQVNQKDLESALLEMSGL